MNPINQQTPGPVYYWPTHWAGGADSHKLDGHNTIWLDSPRGEIARLKPNGGRIDDLVLADGRLLGAAYTAFDKAGRELGIDATTLAQRLDLAALIRAAYAVAMDADRVGGKEPARVDSAALNALCTPLLPFGEALSLAQ